MKSGPARLLAGAPSGRNVGSPTVARIAVAAPGRPGSLVGFANAGDRPPELVVELRLPDRDAGVGHRDVDQRQQSRQIEEIRSHLIGDRHGDLVVEPRRCAQARRAVVGPVDADRRLLVGALGRRRRPSPPRRFTSSKAAA